MTQDQARLVFIMAREGFSAYKRKCDAGEYHGVYLADRLAALSALSAEFGARFPEGKQDGYFHIPANLRRV
jgi:hypothetical protein